MLDSAQPQDPAYLFHQESKAKAMVDQVERSLRTGDMDRARQDLERLGGATASDPVARLLYARTLIVDARFAECEALLEELSLQDPQAGGVDLVRGTMEEARGRWLSARLAYAQAAEKNPGAIRPVLMQARTYHASGDPAGAAALLEREIAVRPAAIELRLALGDAYLANGEAMLAVAHYREALQQDPENQAVLRKTVLALSLSGQHLAALDAATDLSETGMQAHLRLALARSALATGEAARARYWLQMYLDSYGGESAAWVDLARAHLLMDDFAESLEALRMALTLDPGHVEAMILMGHLRASLGQEALAKEAYLEAVRLGADAEPIAPLIHALDKNGSENAAPSQGAEG